YLWPETCVGGGPGGQGVLQRTLSSAVQGKVKETLLQVGEEEPAPSGGNVLRQTLSFSDQPLFSRGEGDTGVCLRGLGDPSLVPVGRLFFKQTRRMSVIVENSAGSTNATEILKPVKKRKRKDYQSPSEEEEYESEQMEKQEERKNSGGDPTISNTESEEWSSSEEKKEGWSWASYLEEQKAIAAPLNLFQESVAQHKNGFKVGMKLEGIDPQHPSMYFILTVAEVCGYRMRLHFDGYSECHDFWLNADSPNIHPAGWSEETGHKLQPPKGKRSVTSGLDCVTNVGGCSGKGGLFGPISNTACVYT
uniref:L3MBTL histone methyl-lysine binding protein 1 n=1 Tax=Terrapene triunguis TaxID=2587831 RepID=A0A674JYA6_9SAUR